MATNRYRIQLAYDQEPTAHTEQVIAARRSFWIVDAQADLPTAAEGAQAGDWCHVQADETEWHRNDANTAWVQVVAGGSGVTVKEDGVSLDIDITTLDFDGSDFNLTETPENEVNISLNYGTGAGQPAEGNHTHASSGYTTIQDDGIAETQRSILNFQDGFEVVDDGVDSTDIDLTYGAAGYPVDSVIGTEADGTSTAVARADHQHAITAPLAGYPVDVAATEADGTSDRPARADHQHAHGTGYLPDAHHAQVHSGADHTDPGAPSQIDIGDAASAGTGTNPPAADDHQHAFPAPTAGYVVDVAATESDGISTTVARADHQHAHGTGYLPDAHHAQVHSGADHTDPGLPVQIDIGDTASAGTGTNPPAADDHQHAFPAPPAGYPVEVSFAAESDGVATTVARSDHRHSITDPTTLPSQIDFDAAASSEGTSTDVARADHNHGVGTDLIFTVGMVFKSPSAADDVMIWTAPFACTVTAVKAWQDTGTGSTYNAFKGSLAAPTTFLAVNQTIDAADTVDDGGAVQNTAVAAGDKIYVRLASVAGSPNEVGIQINLTRP